MQTPTIAAIETAIARAETMYGEYACDAMPSIPGKFYVQHNEDANRCYIVDTRAGRQHCTCPQFKKAAVCKHSAFVKQVEQEAEAEARADYEAFGKHLAGRF